MRLTVIGTGEAYSTVEANAAVLVESQGFRLLVDCGPTVPKALWSLRPDWEDLDAVILTHGHPDHALGLPALVNRMISTAQSENRPLPELPVFCQKNDADQIRILLEYAYWPGTPERPLPIRSLDDRGEIGPFDYDTAPTDHSVPNLGIRLADNDTALFINGDGRLRPDSEALAVQSTAAILECQNLEDDGSPFHSNYDACRALARACPATRFFLTHAADRCRDKIAQLSAGEPNMEMARPGKATDLASIIRNPKFRLTDRYIRS